MSETVVYDKAEWHRESATTDDEPYTFGALFLGWLLLRDLHSEELSSDDGGAIRRFRSRELTATEFYRDLCDGALVDDMIREDVRPFVAVMFDREYAMEYSALAGPSGIVLDDWDTLEKLSACLDRHLERWRYRSQRRKWWPFGRG
jgi:hypothetical protein